MFDKELHDCFSRYVQNCLNLPCVTNTLIARNYVESDREELKKEEEDEKSISLGMHQKASPLSSSSIGHFTWSYIFIRHMICVLLGASCMILVFAF